MVQVRGAVDGAVDAIERFIEDFSWRRLTVWAGVLAVLAAIASFYEWYTHDLRLARLSEQIDLLERLQETTPGGARDTAMAVVYENVRAQVHASVQQGARVPRVAARVWHAVAGFLPWAVMAVIVVSRPEGERIEDAGGAAVAFLLVGIAAGWAVTLLPETWPTVVTHVATPLAIPLLMLFSVAVAKSATGLGEVD